MYKWFLAWRYLHTKLIAFFGIASVMLCVAMVLVVISVMGGFLDTIRSRSRGLHSEIIMTNRSIQGFPLYEEFAAFANEQYPDLVRISTSVVSTYGIMRIPISNQTVPVRVTGIDLENYVKVNDFKKGLHYEKYFPGTTQLGKQQMPFVGVDENGGLTFPPDLVAANKRWREAQSDESVIDQFDANPMGRTLDPRYLYQDEQPFAVRPGPPGYEGRERDGIIIGCDIINERRLDGHFNRPYVRGTDVVLTLLPLSPAGNLSGEPPAKLPLRYVDDSNTGIYEIDSMHVYVDRDLLQHTLAMDSQTRVDGTRTKPRVNMLLIALADGADIDLAREQLKNLWQIFRLSNSVDLDDDELLAVSDVGVYTWEDMQRAFIQAVEKEKVLVTILFSLISVVAIVLVGCIFYMIVEKKTKDIGILKAVGASGRGVAGMFIIYAAAVGIFGSILGLLLGSTFVWNINAIQDFLASLNPALRVWSPDIYSFDRIPEAVKSADAVWIASIAVVSSMVGSLIPAWVAARVWPVRALRYE